MHRDERMRLYECDLLTLQDGPRCRLDAQTLRGFCDERDGYFRLEPVIIGTQVVVNAYTNVCPGASIADGAVHGLDASSYENPSEKSYTHIIENYSSIRLGCYAFFIACLVLMI